MSSAARARDPVPRCAGCDCVIGAVERGAYEYVCECGVVARVFSDDTEYRIFRDEDKDQEEKKRVEAYHREKMEVMPADRAASEEWRRWADTRVNQVKMQLGHLVSEEPGASFLTNDEVRAALSFVRAAAQHVAAHPPDDKKGLASSLFWAIAAAQNVACQRPGGWMVDCRATAEAWGLDALHDRLSKFQSEMHVTSEKLGNATRIGGQGGVAQAAAMVNDVKRRNLRIDRLGDAAARRLKVPRTPSRLQSTTRHVALLPLLPSSSSSPRSPQLPQMAHPRSHVCAAARQAARAAAGGGVGGPPRSGTVVAARARQWARTRPVPPSAARQRARPHPGQAGVLAFFRPRTSPPPAPSPPSTRTQATGAPGGSRTARAGPRASHRGATRRQCGGDAGGQGALRRPRRRRAPAGTCRRPRPRRPASLSSHEEDPGRAGGGRGRVWGAWHAHVRAAPLPP